jgi:hypothetical protein
VIVYFLYGDDRASFKKTVHESSANGVPPTALKDKISKHFIFFITFSVLPPVAFSSLDFYFYLF